MAVMTVFEAREIAKKTGVELREGLNGNYDFHFHKKTLVCASKEYGHTKITVYKHKIKNYFNHIGLWSDKQWSGNFYGNALFISVLNRAKRDFILAEKELNIVLRKKDLEQDF